MPKPTSSNITAELNEMHASLNLHAQAFLPHIPKKDVNPIESHESPPALFLTEWNSLVFRIPQRKVHVLQTLGRSALEQIVNRRADDDPLAAGMDREAAHFDTMSTRNGFDEGGFAGDLDELFTGIAVLVDVADVAGDHLLVQRDGYGVLGKVVSQSDRCARK